MLIAFGGRAGSGKSTAAELLKSLNPQCVEVHHFATPVKVIASIVGGGYESGTSKDSKPSTLVDTDFTWRKLFQLIGTEFGRNMVHPDLWIRLAKPIINNALKNKKIVVLDDLRFKNELEFIKSLNGICVYIDRNLPTMNHASECFDFVELFDRTIDNNGSLSEFHYKIVELALDRGIIPMVSGPYQLDMFVPSPV